MSRHAPALAAPALAALGFALACSSGGGGGEGEATTEIGTANAEVIASEVAGALLFSANLSAIGGGITQAVLIDAAAAPAEHEPALVVALRAALAAADDRLPNLAGAEGIAANAVLDPTIVDCDTSGTATISGDIAGPGAIAQGDHIEVQFDACVNHDANGDNLPQLDGQLAFTVLAFSGDLDDLFSVTLDTTFTDLEQTAGGATLGVKGRATTIYDNTAPPRVESTIRGSSLEFVDGSSNTLLLRNFETVLSRNTADDDFHIRGDAHAASTRFEGEVVYETIDPLAGALEVLPDEGVVDVRGANDSVLRIVPLTGFNVDFGTAYAPPPKTFGAAANQAGRWNNVGLGDTTLAGLRGGASRVHLKVGAAKANGAASQPTDDAQRLLNDHFTSSSSGAWSVTLSNLAIGDYRVYLYAPTDPSVATGAMSVGGIPVSSLSGDPGGSLIEGTSWASVDGTLLSDTLAITGSDSAASGLAGLQIVPDEDDAVNLEIDADGDGDVEDTIMTTWSQLGF